MAAQSLPLSLADFHRLYEGAKPAYEYWHGAAVQKSMPTVLHGIVQFVIMLLLEKAGWNAASEVRLKVGSDAEPVPDVIAVRGKFKGRYPTAVPELCIEIMSPTDTLAKALEKAKSYMAWGAEAAWIIDPEKRTAWTLLREELPEPVWVSPGGSLRVADTAIGLSTLFAEVDQRLELTPDFDSGE